MAHGIRIKQLDKLEVIPARPMYPSELSARYPLDEVARRGGGVLNSIAGASKVDLKFSPRSGYIDIHIRGEHAVVHKDELLYFVRMAKGRQA